MWCQKRLCRRSGREEARLCYCRALRGAAEPRWSRAVPPRPARAPPTALPALPETLEQICVRFCPRRAGAAPARCSRLCRVRAVRVPVRPPPRPRRRTVLSINCAKRSYRGAAPRRAGTAGGGAGLREERDRERSGRVGNGSRSRAERW